MCLRLWWHQTTAPVWRVMRVILTNWYPRVVTNRLMLALQRNYGHRLLLRLRPIRADCGVDIPSCNCAGAHSTKSCCVNPTNCGCDGTPDVKGCWIDPENCGCDCAPGRKGCCVPPIVCGWGGAPCAKVCCLSPAKCCCRRGGTAGGCGWNSVCWEIPAETVAAAPTPPEVVPAVAPLMATVAAASSGLMDIAPAAPNLPPRLRSQVSPLCQGHPEHQPLQHMEIWGAVRPHAKIAPAVAPNCHQGSPAPTDHHHPMVLIGDLQPCHLSDLYNQTSPPLQLLRHLSPLPATPPATASFPATMPQTALSNPGSQPTFHHLLTADHLPEPHFPSLQHPVAAAVEKQSGCPSEWSPVVHTHHLTTTHPVTDALPAESKMGSSNDVVLLTASAVPCRPTSATHSPCRTRRLQVRDAQRTSPQHLSTCPDARPQTTAML